MNSTWFHLMNTSIHVWWHVSHLLALSQRQPPQHSGLSPTDHISCRQCTISHQYQFHTYWQWKPSNARELTSLSNTPLGTTKVKLAMLVSENCKLKAGHPFNVSKLQSPYCTWSKQTIHILRKPLQFVKGTDYIQHPSYSWSYFQTSWPLLPYMPA